MPRYLRSAGSSGRPYVQALQEDVDSPRMVRSSPRGQTRATRRGRNLSRLTSSKRTTPPSTPTVARARKPLTPTTKKAIAKARRHRAYEKKRAKEAEMEKFLARYETYWRVLRNGKKYRALGGTRRE